MSQDSINRLLDRLEALKIGFDDKARPRLLKILGQLSRREIKDADALIRLHEMLLFICAYPSNREVRRRAEKILSSFKRRVESLREREADFSAFIDPEVSGIVGTAFSSTFTYDIAHWLALHHPKNLTFDFDGYESDARLGETLPRFIPLLEEDALVEANVPFREWMRLAAGVERQEVAWLLESFRKLRVSAKERAELYDSLQLWICWHLNKYSASRTGHRAPLRPREIFYHQEALLRRKDVSLEAELNSPPFELKKVSPRDGRALLDFALETSAARYRELYGFTHGDFQQVFHTHAGRGTDIYFFGVPPERRLPVRAYHAALIFKNRVPIGYAESLTLFERMEFGFNLYYTFRDGESAWTYARALHLFCQLLKARAVSVDPYQIGHENEEGIESGAFWFYRKLGFRPVKSEIAKLVEREERRLASRENYRTSARTLRKIAEGHLLFTLPPAPRSEWDNFHVRNLGLAAQRRMAQKFDSDSLKFRRASVERVADSLGLRVESFREDERRAFSDWSLMLALIPDIERWTTDEKMAVLNIIRAKAGRDEARYIRLMQKHERLRREVIKLGS
ncbi:MAG: hypothetical protein AUG51_03955 [Acidobacteria bacterium 13_1_20CM_3_53_8]|nr:MAG: hypothetical protein AUG51_03955 [Acidobacteria bacterium 13_1_20CM_3_53_8]